MRLNTASPGYLEIARQLDKEQTERLLSRMRGRFARRLDDRQLSSVEALALQLEYEDKELAEWRKRVAEIREKFAELDQSSEQPSARRRPAADDNAHVSTASACVDS